MIPNWALDTVPLPKNGLQVDLRSTMPSRLLVNTLSSLPANLRLVLLAHQACPGDSQAHSMKGLPPPQLDQSQSWLLYHSPSSSVMPPTGGRSPIEHPAACSRSSPGCFGICTNDSRFRFTLAFALKCIPGRGAEQGDPRREVWWHILNRYSPTKTHFSTHHNSVC